MKLNIDFKIIIYKINQTLLSIFSTNNFALKNGWYLQPLFQNKRDAKIRVGSLAPIYPLGFIFLTGRYL